MISELRIRGIGVIDESVIEFAPGLTVVTGETGAGKTMILTGLAMLRGAKADAGLVRTGVTQAQADGVWQFEQAKVEALGRVLEDTGVDTELTDAGHSELVLSRSVAAEGRSRAFAGGRVVPAATLEQLTDALLAVHGQSDQVRLTDPRRQRALLDRFGGLLPLHEAYATAFGKWRAITSELASLRQARKDLDREATLLRLGLAEIDEVEPLAGEDDDLKARAAVLAHATDLADQLARAHALISEDDASALDALGAAMRELERAEGVDASLASIRLQLSAAIDALQSVGLELAARAASAESDPEQLEQIEERRQLISQLKRKYGPTLEEVLSWRAQAEATVAAADGADGRLAELEALQGPALDAVRARADALSRGRRDAAARLADQVTGELHALAMGDALASIQVETTDDPAEFTADGADSVAFLLKPHAGAPLRPVGNGASGGELSRVMLAIEVCLADASPVPTFVFDEVDAGIGGKVAVEVGTRLSRLAQQSQVIVVTHLPQVAAFADRHVVVRKETDGSVTSSSVETVEGVARVEELVRMLSGLEGSASGAEHAAELLAVAQRVRDEAGAGADQATRGSGRRATPTRTKRRA